MKYLKFALLLCYPLIIPAQLTASTIGGSVNCGAGNTGLYNYGAVSCGSPSGAYAYLNIQNWIVTVMGGREQGPPYTLGIASGFLTDEVELTITGGTGDGLFFPDVVAVEDPGSESGAQASFGTATTGCNGVPPFSECQFAFTYGVPQTFQVDLYAYTYSGLTQGWAQASFGGVIIVNAQGQTIYPQPTFTLVDVGPAPAPEPGTLFLSGLGLAALGRRLRARARS